MVLGNTSDGDLTATTTTPDESGDDDGIFPETIGMATALGTALVAAWLLLGGD